MSDFVTVARVGEIPAGEGRAFEVDGIIVGVFNVEGEYWTIDDFCPHQGASLAAGELTGTCITCPLHGWRFDVTDGTWLDNPTSKLKAETFQTRVIDGEIQVKVD